MLKYPQLKKRIDKSLPKTNSIIPNIENVFSEFNTTSFHFFTDNNSKVKNKIWKIVLFEKGDENNLENLLLQFVGEKELESEMLLLNNYGLNLEYILFNDNTNWKTGGDIYVANFNVKPFQIQINRFSLQQFEALLLSIQGQEMIMNKPLLYSTTELEGYLADMCQSNRYPRPKNRAIFPGDADIIIFAESEVKYLIELKKHTKSWKIDGEGFSKYWSLDNKKYKGLMSLAKSFNLNFFINFIYTTTVDLNKVKLEKISINGELILDEIINFKNLEDLKLKIRKFLENNSF